MKFLPAVVLWAISVCPLFGRPFTVVAYNVEHLFDVDDRANLEDYQPAKYTRAHALTKFKNAARVIANFERGQGPDIVILAELEADLTPASQRLEYDKILQHYASVTLDEMLGAKFDRDIADLPAEVLLAKALADRGVKGYQLVLGEESNISASGRRVEHKNAVFTRFPVKASRSHPTPDARAILEVQVEIDGAALYVFSNHWKSGASDPATEPSRMANAKTLRTRLDEILRADGNADIVIGGDLNSQYNQKQRYPRMTQTGINDILRSQGNEAAVLGPQRDLYNLWYELPVTERGSDTYRGEWGTLMHLIISGGLYDYRGVQYVDNSFAVAKFPGVNADASGLPIRWSFDGVGGSGFSDHFPIAAKFVTVSEGRGDRFLTLRNPSVEDIGAVTPTKIGYAQVDLAKATLETSNIPAGTSLRSADFKGKIFRVEGCVAPGARLAVDFRGETYDVWSFDETLRNELRAKYPAGSTIRFYGELGQFRDRWQFVIQDASWVK